jgi:hypothetical protein
MRCRNCGTEQPESSRYCGECGAPLRSNDAPPVPPIQPPTQSAPAWTPPPVPQPPWNPPQPYPTGTDYDALRRINAEQKSFTTPAIITLVLYIVLWLPGLVANIVYLNEANNVQRISGREPEGKGCLIAMLVVFVGLPVIGFCLFIGVAVLSA